MNFLRSLWCNCVLAARKAIPFGGLPIATCGPMEPEDNGFAITKEKWGNSVGGAVQSQLLKGR